MGLRARTTSMWGLEAMGPAMGPAMGHHKRKRWLLDSWDGGTDGIYLRILTRT